MKNLYIAEKPSVAQEFAKALKENFTRKDGYLESDGSVVTWCVGHLITMSYPEVYDPALKQWKADTLPFLPKTWKYEVIGNVKKQFEIVKGLLNRDDVERIYVCTDSGREGEYIYRLVDQMAKVPATKDKRRVWIDSQTEEEILRGIREAKPLSAYDNLSDAAYLRAKEDYLMGINFSRALTINYGTLLRSHMQIDRLGAISVGRVMTCVLGMVVRREQDIRNFVKTPFYRVMGAYTLGGEQFHGEWRAVKGSKYFESPLLYKENGFRKREDAEALIEMLGGVKAPAEAEVPAENGTAIPAENVTSAPAENAESAVTTADAVMPETDNRYIVDGSDPECTQATLANIEKKKEKKNPPLLFNLAELQNECSRLFKISPDETLKIVQLLYEKKLVTYPRTDARVLSTAVAKEITKNLGGLAKNPQYLEYVRAVKSFGLYEKIAKTKYVNDKQITDHYAIIPTGEGLSELASVNDLAKKVYDRIVRRFLAIFYPPAEYQKIAMELTLRGEHFFSSFKVLENPGYLALYSADEAKRAGADDGAKDAKKEKKDEDKDGEGAADEPEEVLDTALFDRIKALKAGAMIDVAGYELREGETKPPKRYTSGSLILAMENAGQLIEDEELRAQIKGSGIGTSATRAEILNKLIKINYLNLNKKTQVITPKKLGELVFYVVLVSIRSLLNPELTASWEKGLTQVAEGVTTEKEYLEKLEAYVTKWTEYAKTKRDHDTLRNQFYVVDSYYRK
ncbi:MAG: type IA DNA topoisomerase [Lachnospiraceae bacterium]|nr:type IA DNA topoisomerase [Lachnospiraceae bacterium]